MRRTQQFATILLFSALLAACATAQQTMEGCRGTVNEQPLIDVAPTLIARVNGGQKYTIPYDGRLFYVVVVNGSAYDMGYAQGQLMREEIAEEVPAMWEFAAWFLKNNSTDLIKTLPAFLQDIIANTAIDLVRGLLDLNWYICKPYTPLRFDEELNGIADASGVDVWELRQLNLITELFKAWCSIFGAYNTSTTTRNTMHLRALDWESHAPMAKWPTIVVYHPTEAGSVPFANIAWPGFIGTLTGYSSAKIGIGERLGDDPMSTQSRFGTPWNYVIRDALQFSKTHAQALQWLNDAKRTCSIYLGVGGNNAFSICNYTAEYLRCYDWLTWPSDYNHPHMEYVMWKEYHESQPCFMNIVKKFYGNISAETVYRYVAPLGETGDSQVAVMDYENDIVYCMYSNPVTANPGYNCPPIKIDLKPFFSTNILEA